MILERVEGIEPSHPPWQGDRLPLHHTRMVRAENYDISTYWLKASCSSSELRPPNLVATVGIEPTSAPYQDAANPLSYAAMHNFL